jgi:xanthine dehydrogenase YagT iron-sulfur-binding subunit
MRIVESAPTQVSDDPAVVRGPQSEPVVLTINGATYAVDLEPRVSLLDALREHLDLTGTKKAPARCGSTTGGCSRASRWR